MPESRISLPADVLDPLSLRRTLSAIVDELGIITGAKGVDPYVKESELPEAEVTLSSLNAALTELKAALATIDESNDDVEEAVEALLEAVAKLSNVTEYDQASVAMLDFNNTVWSSLEGLFQLSDLGENFSNAPEALTTGVTYNVYVQSFKTLGEGSVQEVVIENTSASEIKVYKRAADSFTQLLANGWFNVQNY